MDYVTDAILNHLNMKTTGALLLTGEWGSGKTYYLKNHVFSEVESRTDYIPIIVSLYGENDKNNIAQKVLFSYFDKKGKTANLSTGTLTKNIKQLTDAIPFLKKYVDVEKLILGTGENMFRLIPHDKLLICFDDLERMSDKIDVDDFLGIVNDLVENKNSKVLLIANEEQIKNGITFKEKTIEKTIHFKPNLALVFDSIIRSYEYIPFREYLNLNREFFLKSLNPIHTAKQFEDELVKSFSNIRTMKFAIEHFHFCYAILNNEKSKNEELLKMQLRSLWLFILSVSIEFRKPNNISFHIKNKLDAPNLILSDLDFSSFLQPENADADDQKLYTQWDYLKEFKEKYYDRLSEPYVFFPDIYDLITGGMAVSKETFLQNLDKSFNIKEGVINPAHAALNKLFSGYSVFSDSEFEETLKALLEYTAEGRLDDLVSYLNAAAYLLRFHDMFETTKETVIEKLMEGVSIFLAKINWNDHLGNELDMVSTSFPDEHIQNFIKNIQAKILELEKENEKSELAKLQTLFTTNFEAFINQLLPDNSQLRSPFQPILHRIEPKAIINSILTLSPKALTELISLLKVRYIDNPYPERLSEEVLFLENLELAIQDIDLTKKTLSNYLIGEKLITLIEQCKKKLKEN